MLLLDVENLNSISLDNNETCCYEFAAILNKFIKRAGGVVNKLIYGGKGHSHSMCCIDNTKKLRI